MSVELDHAFICCAEGAPEGDTLVAAGFQEGSPNQHPGQGTANRRFFFVNAYLELVWVTDPAEARSESVLPTQLWERWSLRQAGACPFGLVFRPGASIPETPPFPTQSYVPGYLPPHLSIEVAVGVPIHEPGLFFLSFARRPRSPHPQPIQHQLPVHEISCVRVGLPAHAGLSDITSSATTSGLFETYASPEYILEFTFNSAAKGQAVDFRPALPFVLRL